MASTDDESPENVPWFRRLRPDGRMEPHVARGDRGEMIIIDSDGWAASFKDGKWTEGLLFHHEQMAEFSPVENQQAIYRALDEARAALGAKGEMER